MEVLQCLKCKGQIVLEDGGQVGKCASCDTAYYFKAEKNARVISLLNQANFSRLRGDFDGAILAYQIVLKEDETDADAYWGIALSKFGIEYVEDERTGQIIPTCRRTIKHSILSDTDYLSAIEFASEEQKQDFIKKAEEIDNLQKAIKEKVEEEQDYDVFLCFKSTDQSGNATEDRFIARAIYDELEKRGIRTFFSEKSLKNRLGEDYEPIIYKALYTCKIFILIATKDEYIQAPWVRNEWSRFRDRAADEGLHNSAFGVFKDIKQNQLPPIFRSQGVDLAKYPAGGYEIEIADNLETRLNVKRFSSISDSFGQMFSQSNAVIFEDKVVDLLEKKLVGSRQTYEEKIERALTYNEIGNKDKSVEILNSIIDEYPRKAMGWFYKAQLLTDNFNIEFFTLAMDKEKAHEALFAIENATRFATEEEKSAIVPIVNEFNTKLSTIESVDRHMSSFDEALKNYLTEVQKANKILGDEKQQNFSPESYKNAIEQNNNKLKKLKKQIANKNYYTKNIVVEPNILHTALIFLGVVIFMITAIATLINLIMLGPTVADAIAFWIEFVLMLLLGISPFAIASILKTNKKLKQVRSFIEKEKQEYEIIRQENIMLKSLYHQASKNVLEVKEEDDGKRVFVVPEKLTKEIVEPYKKLKKLYIENEYIKNYINTVEHAQAQVLIENIQKAKKELERQELDISLLEKQIKELDTELEQNKPKYFSLKYEKMANNLKELIKKFKAQKAVVLNEIESLKFDIEFGNLKLEKTIGSDTFFDNFLQEQKELTTQYLQPKQNEEKQKILKVDTEKAKKHKLSSKKAKRKR